MRRARARWPLVDHGGRAIAHYGEVLGSQLAAGVTYFAFLSFFPLIALGFVLISLNAMRAGLLTRFMGVLGIIVGALLVFPIPSPVVVGRSPAGRGGTAGRWSLSGPCSL